MDEIGVTAPLEFGEDYFNAMTDGKEHRVTEAVYDYFLGVLPPVMSGNIVYQGKQWGFGFAEGCDHVTLFRHDRATGEFFAQQTPWLNPREAGSIESQTKRLILKWLAIGRRNEWIRRGRRSAVQHGIVLMNAKRTPSCSISSRTVTGATARRSSWAISASLSRATATMNG